MKLVVLCSGEASRMRPLSYKYPKPLIPIEGKTNLESIIDSFANKDYINETIVISSDRKFFERAQLSSEITQLCATKKPSEFNNCYTMYDVLKYLQDNSSMEDLIVIEGDIRIGEGIAQFVVDTIISGLDCSSKVFTTYRTNEWVLYKDRSGQTTVSKNSRGWSAMTGISYVSKQDAQRIFEVMDSYDEFHWDLSRDRFWDEFFVNSGRLSPCVCNPDIVRLPVLGKPGEFDTIDDLISQNYLTEKEVVKLLSDSPSDVIEVSKFPRVYQIKFKGQDFCFSRDPACTLSYLKLLYSENSLDGVVSTKQVLMYRLSPGSQIKSFKDQIFSFIEMYVSPCENFHYDIVYPGKDNRVILSDARPIDSVGPGFLYDEKLLSPSFLSLYVICYNYKKGCFLDSSFKDKVCEIVKEKISTLRGDQLEYAKTVRLPEANEVMIFDN